MIQATFYNEAVDTYKESIETGKVYLFTKGMVKGANRQFTAIDNDYTISFNTRAQVVEVTDDETIASMTFDLVSIDDISDMNEAKHVDVIAMVLRRADPYVVTIRNGAQRIK